MGLQGKLENSCFKIRVMLASHAALFCVRDASHLDASHRVNLYANALLRGVDGTKSNSN